MTMSAPISPSPFMDVQSCAWHQTDCHHAGQHTPRISRSFGCSTAKKSPKDSPQ